MLPFAVDPESINVNLISQIAQGGVFAVLTGYLIIFHIPKLMDRFSTDLATERNFREDLTSKFATSLADLQKAFSNDLRECRTFFTTELRDIRKDLED